MKIEVNEMKLTIEGSNNKMCDENNTQAANVMDNFLESIPEGSNVRITVEILKEGE